MLKVYQRIKLLSIGAARIQSLSVAKTKYPYMGILFLLPRRVQQLSFKGVWEVFGGLFGRGQVTMK